MEEKKLQVKKKGFWTKIKEFLMQEISFKKIDCLEDKTPEEKEVVIPENFEKQNILRMQEKYREKTIHLEDLTQEEFSKLVALYEAQNKELEEKIEILKKTKEE